MNPKSTGYDIKVYTGISGVDWKKAEALKESIKQKYGVDVYFPIESSIPRHNDNQTIRICKRDLDLLDEVLAMLKEHHYQIQGIERILE